MLMNIGNWLKTGKFWEILTSVIAIIIFMSFTLYMISSVRKNSTTGQKFQTFTARFNDIDGILVGSDVKLSGYKVGSVKKIVIIPESYDVKVTIEIIDTMQLPSDTTAAVKTSGLLGGKYIALIPGAEDTYLEKGSEILYTQSAINLENLIGTFVNKS